VRGFPLPRAVLWSLRLHAIDRAWWSRCIPVVFVPLVVAGTHIVAAWSVPLRFCLVPPLAVLAQRGAAAPRAPAARLPSMVVAPSVGALLGTAASVALGPMVVAFLLLTFVMMLLLRLGRWQLPPALSIALLALVLRLHTFWYPLDVAGAAAALWLSVLGLGRLQDRLRQGGGQMRDAP
jgi:hypothetical protein